MKQSALLLMLALLVLGTSPVQAKRSPVGYAGCSISTQIVRGYFDAGGGDFWRPRSVFDGKGTLGTYPGGAMVLWAMALTDDLNGLLSYWKDFDAMNRVYRSAFGSRYPARSTPQVKIPFGALVGMEVTAYRSRRG